MARPLAAERFTHPSGPGSQSDPACFGFRTQRGGVGADEKPRGSSGTDARRANTIVAQDSFATSPGEFIPCVRAVFEALSPVMRVADFAIPNPVWLGFTEVRNKVEVFDLVRNPETRLRTAGQEPISDLVETAYGLGDFYALWAIEGIGILFARRAFRYGMLHRLLKDPRSLRVSAHAFAMLNAGLGAAIAESLLPELDVEASGPSCFDFALKFKSFCSSNSTPGYEGAAYESLGLVTRMLRPAIYRRLGQYLSLHHPELESYYWHGCGRSFYFSRDNLLRPLASLDWRSEVAVLESEIARKNFIAGFVWAATLVNMMEPRILEQFVEKSSLGLLENDAFSNGLHSSIAVRLLTTPKTGIVSRLCDHQPELAHSEERWKTYVRSQRFCALRCSPTLHSTLKGKPGLLFAYQEFERSMEANETVT